jgi:pilin isopeptide linkage protein
MERMFSLCRKLNQIDVSAWDVSVVTDMESMFYGCNSLRQLDLSDWVTSGLIKMRMMFTGCAVELLDLSGFDTSLVTSMSNAYDGISGLCTVILGDNNPFVGSGTAFAVLSIPPFEKDGVVYTGKWIRNDGTAGPYSPEELRDNYVSSMAGTWIWEKVPTEYNLTFACIEDGYVGEMPSVVVESAKDYVLPLNAFRVFGKVFDHWTDGTRRIYADGGTVPANTYAAGDVVTLTAVFEPRDTSILMQDGEFTFSLKGGEKALFENVPAGTSYQVFEENLPEDWILIAQSNTTGLVESLEESNAIFLNKYQPDMATIQFTLRKLMDGQPAKAESFSFELWEGNVLLQTKSVIDGGFVQFDMLEYDRNDVGIHTYTIKELIGTEDSVLYDGHEETIAVEVTIDDSVEDGVVRVYARVTYSDGTYPNIVFQNWTKPGELSLKKLVDDLLAGHENDEFRFRIRFKQENGLPLTDEMTYRIEP